jgi:hypothetical protein
MRERDISSESGSEKSGKSQFPCNESGVGIVTTPSDLPEKYNFEFQRVLNLIIQNVVMSVI